MGASAYHRIVHSVLDKDIFPAKNTANSGAIRHSGRLGPEWLDPESMTPSRLSQPAEKRPDLKQCKHPRVRIVAREEDAEFVECLECGEVFESSEFKDMDIEETKLKEG